MRFSVGVLLVLATLPVPASARGDDSSSAIDELKAGYALKQSGKLPRSDPAFLGELPRGSETEGAAQSRGLRGADRRPVGRAGPCDAGARPR